MNKIVIIVISIVVFASSCKQPTPLTYKYQDRPSLISCEGLDTALANEALYSFQEDISKLYNMDELLEGSKPYYLNGYRFFTYFGLDGSAPYQDVMSDHTYAVFQELKDQKELWNTQGKLTWLNYDSKFISCLIDNFENEDIRLKLQNMKKVNYLAPQYLAEPMRREIQSIIADPNLAMYLAMDGFYQFVYQKNITPKPKDE